MSRRHVVVCVGLAAALTGCGGGDDPAVSCEQVRERAKAAAETGARLKAERSADSAAITASATDYVNAVRSRPDCFSDGQKANAEEVGATLPTSSTSRSSG